MFYQKALITIFALFITSQSMALVSSPSRLSNTADAWASESGSSMVAKSNENTEIIIRNSSEKTFPEALQEKILNILTQQLFDQITMDFSSDLFVEQWIYQTHTFNVNIQSADQNQIRIVISNNSRIGDSKELLIQGN